MGKCDNKLQWKEKIQKQALLINPESVILKSHHMQYSPNRHISHPYSFISQNQQSLTPITHTKFPSEQIVKEGRILNSGKETHKPLPTQTNSNKNIASPVTIKQNIFKHSPFPDHGVPPASSFPASNQKQLTKSNKNKQISSLQPTITSHTNPIYRKIAKLRPNSEDSKYQYNQVEKERNRYESETKARNTKQDEQQTTLISQGEEDAKPVNKSPYKSTYNQFHQSGNKSQSESVATSKLGTAGSGMSDQKFLQKCLQHIMIQNSCLTKQVVVKQMELTRLRHELDKLRSHYSSCKKAKLDIEGLGNMSVIVSANEEDSQFNHSQCSISERCQRDLVRQTTNNKWMPKQAESQNIDSRVSDSEITFSIENRKEQSNQKDHENLAQIHELIHQIENEERKLELIETNSPSVRQQDTQQSEELEEGSQKKEDKDPEQSYPLEGMQFTRLDRLRMKKGITSKRQRK